MKPTLEEVDRRLTAPGSPFEIERRSIRGIKTRTWKQAPTSLAEVVRFTGQFGARTFLIAAGRSWSYDAHNKAVAALAAALVRELGVAKGDRVALAMRNLPEWPMVFFAATSVGAIAVPLNAWWTADELAYGLADCGAKVLFADPERLARITPHRPRLPHLAAVIGAGEAPNGTALDLSELLGRHDGAALPDGPIKADDPATIFYTSGTTGTPKGALGTHRNICSNIWSTAYSRARNALRQGQPIPLPGAAAEPKTGLVTVPFFHATGCHSILLTNYYAGNRLVLMHKWDPERALGLIAENRVTNFSGVPGMAWQILSHPRRGDHDLSSLEVVGTGGAPAAPDLVGRITRDLPGVTAGNGYGMTETSALVTQNLGQDYQARPDSVGAPVPVCELRICDSDGRALPRGEVGELWIKGPNVVQGYWAKPAATAAAFHAGWIKSGDAARIDDAGFVRIVDRIKDMVIRGGENVPSVEVEDAIFAHPEVVDAAVFGVPDRVLGERVAAVVTVPPGCQVTADQLRRFVAGRLAYFKVPEILEIRREPLPRNANGKIEKRRLRDALIGAGG